MLFILCPIPSTGWVLLTGLRREEIHSMTQSMLYASISKGPLLGMCITAFLLLTAAIIIWIILSLKESSKENERLEISANRDPLTGIKNRNCFRSDAEMLAAGSCRTFACVYMDANGLHEINNHMEHAAGDQMLKDLAEVLRQVFGPEYVYRIGGDEFVAFCLNQDKPEVFRRMNGKERQLRVLNKELEQILLEKQDADTFLSVWAPGFNGVYFVNLSGDAIRHLFIPSYFQELLEETKDKFSEALRLNANRIEKLNIGCSLKTSATTGIWRLF